MLPGFDRRACSVDADVQHIFTQARNQDSGTRAVVHLVCSDSCSLTRKFPHFVGCINRGLNNFILTTELVSLPYDVQFPSLKLIINLTVCLL